MELARRAGSGRCTLAYRATTMLQNKVINRSRLSKRIIAVGAMSLALIQ